MSTHEVEITLKVKARMHVRHGLVGAAERQAIKEAKADVAAWVGRRFIGVAVGGGNAGATWTVTGVEQG